MNQNNYAKKKYEKPVSRNLNSLVAAAGDCTTGPTDVAGGCGEGGTAGGRCYPGVQAFTTCETNGGSAFLGDCTSGDRPQA